MDIAHGSSLIPTLTAHAAAAQPVRLFTGFGVFDGMPGITMNGAVTLSKYRAESGALNLGKSETSNDRQAFVAMESPVLTIAPEVIQGVVAITTPPIHEW